MDYVTLPRQDNRSTWNLSVTALSGDDGSPIDLTDPTYTIALQVYGPNADCWHGADYGWDYGFGRNAEFSFTNADDEVVVVDDTVTISVQLAPRCLPAGDYRVSLFLTDGTNYAPLLRGVLPIIESYAR